MFEILKSIALGVFSTITSVIMIFSGSPEATLLQNTPPEITQREVVVIEKKSVDSSNETGKESPDLDFVPKKEAGIQPPQKTITGADLEAQLKEVEEKVTALIETSNQISISEKIPESAENLNEKIRNAVVNVFCISNSNSVGSITGSGIVIDPRGVVLTNAHIGQYLLLNDYVTCTLRIGSPAQNRYTIEPLYVSPSWIKANYEKINDNNPKGTGEDDFALLRIVGRTNPEAELPQFFPSITYGLDPNTPDIDDNVIIVGYPAGFLGGTIIQNGLSLLSTVGTVGEIFTFKESSLDLFSIFGSILAQKGSSGGAVADTEGNLIGIVVTATQENSTSDRELRAITVSHINRSLIKDFNVNLPNFLLGPLDEKANQFQTLIAPNLRSLLLESF